MTQSSEPGKVVLNRQILMFCGSGGVGKTTLAAATAVWAATQGRKVLVVTIDPARRLANALGLSGLDVDEKPVDLGSLAGRQQHGELFAMMMDTKRVMDDLITKFAPTPEISKKILSQKLYQVMSDSLVGAQEVAALGKLYELHFKRDYDLVVVDTAPTKHAIDFFETPQRLIHLFDAEVLGWFMKPMESISSLGMTLFRKSANFLSELIDKAFGIRALSDLGDFLGSVQGLAGSFRERTEKILEVLQDSERSSFAVVTSPQRLAAEEALYICRKLEKLDLHLAFSIVNRVTGSPDVQSLEPLKDPVTRTLVEAQLNELGLDLGILERLSGLTDSMARHDRENIGEFRRRLGRESVPLERLPFLSEEIVDLQGLNRLALALYEDRSIGSTQASGGSMGESAQRP